MKLTNRFYVYIKIIRENWSWIIINVMGMLIFLLTESWLDAPRPPEQAFNSFDILHLWVTRELPILVLFAILNFVWLMRLLITDNHKDQNAVYVFWSLICLMWFWTVSIYGTTVLTLALPFLLALSNLSPH